MLSKLLITSPSLQYTQRAALNGLGFALNAAIIRQGLTALRTGAPMPTSPIPTLDERNETDEAIRGADHVQQLLVEDNGFEGRVDPVRTAEILKSIREILAESMLKHARVIEHPVTGERVPSEYYVARSFEDTYDFQLSQGPRYSTETQIQAMIRAFPDITREVVLKAQRERHERQQQYQREHRDEVLTFCNSVQTIDGDLETLEDKLPTMLRLQLYAATLRGLAKGRMKEIENFVTGNPNAEGNIALLNGLINEVHDDLDALLADDRIKRDIKFALDINPKSFPAFPPRPPKAQPSLKDEAMTKAPAKQVMHKDGSVSPIPA